MPHRDDKRRKAAPPPGGGPLGRTAPPDAESPATGEPAGSPEAGEGSVRPRKSVAEQVERMEGEGGPPSPSRHGLPRGE